MNPRLKAFLVVVNVLLVILTIGAYLAPYIDPEVTFFFPILGLGYPALLVSNLIAIFCWLLIDRRYAWMSVLTMILGYTSCAKLINLSAADKASGQEITIASYNSNFLKPIAFAPESERPSMEADLETYLRSLELDVLCVQESGWRSDQHIQNALNYEHVHQIEGLTLSIYSKFPFVSSGIVDFQSNVANTCIWTDIDLGKDTLRIYTTHLESNRHDGNVPKVIEQEAPEEMSNSALLGILKHYQRFTKERSTQARMIQKHRGTSPYPVVICGDFNDTPQTYVYRVARDDMQDTFMEEGSGIGSTFGEKIPGLRIDHIFVDKTIEVLTHEISKNDFSDHYLIKTDLEL